MDFVTPLFHSSSLKYHVCTILFLSALQTNSCPLVSVIVNTVKQMRHSQRVSFRPSYWPVFGHFIVHQNLIKQKCGPVVVNSIVKTSRSYYREHKDRWIILWHSLFCYFLGS